MTTIEATEADGEALADIIWFIRGRLSAMEDRGSSSELGSVHLEALRRFRVSLVAFQALTAEALESEARARVAEHRARLLEHYVRKSAKKKGKK